MIENLPVYISIIFILTTLLALFLFYRALKASPGMKNSSRPVAILFGCILWLSFQTVLSLNDFYLQGNDKFPPRFLMLVGPPVLAILFSLLSKSGKAFLDQLPQTELTYLHIVRIPVEIVLLLLFLNQVVPQIMTFEGRNFDILAGISAPVMAYWGISKGMFSRRIILIWNFICLALLLNIVLHGILSAPTLLQQFAFDQPNIALMYFPFSWLPSFVAPLVLFSHVACIRRNLKGN